MKLRPEKLKKIETELSRKLTDDGQIIAAGFASLRAMAMRPDVPELQLREMRMAFFAGAAHLFGSIMNIMDEGDEPTDRDMNRMSLIAAELEAFNRDIQTRYATSRGNA